MSSAIGSLVLVLAVSTTGGHRHDRQPTNILPNGPGYGGGFANGQPDGYGYHDLNGKLPLGDNRTPEYHFPRYYSVPAEQMFFPTYYNTYTTRGQRFLPYVGAGGCHSMGTVGPQPTTPVHPYDDTLGTTPRTALPKFNGRVEAPPINPGGTGLRP
jgi:hypothetical protein